MQAGNGQSFGGDGIADLHSPRRRQQVRFLAKGEGGNFQAVVADLASKGALTLERQFTNNFVAKRQAHLGPDSGEGRKLGGSFSLWHMSVQDPGAPPTWPVPPAGTGERRDERALPAKGAFPGAWQAATAAMRHASTPKRKLAPRVLGSQPFKSRQWRPALRGEVAVRRVLPATRLFAIRGKNASAELV